jgi:pimeloyl-ACP methyl ester carboxylesterase
MTINLKTVLAAGALALAVGSVAAQDIGVKNIVLVHGAWADGSGWRPIYEILKKDGYNVRMVQNPLTSLTDDVAATDRVLDRMDGPTILVGHSYGGAVITEAGDHEPNRKDDLVQRDFPCWVQRSRTGNAFHSGRSTRSQSNHARDAAWTRDCTKGSGALGHQVSFVRKNCPRRHNPLFNSPICGQIQRLLEVRELEAFAERYISLLDVSAEMGVHPLRIKKLMRQNGVVPAFTRPAIPATYFRRSEVSRHPSK